MNATEFCRLVEAKLGWEAPRGEQWKRYNPEAGKVNRKISTNPVLYTWENLQLAVALLAREKQSRTPIGVFAHVERAIEMSVEKEVDIEEEIRKVVAYENERGDPNGWGERFARTQGHHRFDALNEWRWGVK